MSSHKSRFVRRVNNDGTTDSICCNCFVTVATAKRGFELDFPERRHVCDPMLLEYWKEMAEGKRTQDRMNSERCSLGFAWNF